MHGVPEEAEDGCCTVKGKPLAAQGEFIGGVVHQEIYIEVHISMSYLRNQSAALHGVDDGGSLTHNSPIQSSRTGSILDTRGKDINSRLGRSTEVLRNMRN